MPLLLAAWLTASVAGGVPTHAVILLYHHVDDSTPAATTTPPALFAAQLAWLADNDHQVLSLAAVADSLRTGTPLPDRTVALSFDDGFVSVYHEAFPLLKARGWPFTVFVCPETIDEGGAWVLTWDQLREMASAGATVANHGLRHTHMQRRGADETEAAWRTRMRTELVTAQERIEEEMGAARRLFAYPYGEFDPDLRALVIEQGWAGFGQQSGPAGEHSDPAVLPRFPMTGTWGKMEVFPEKVRSLPLPVLEAEPLDPRIEPDDKTLRRPVLRLKLADTGKRWQQVTAYASNQGRADAVWEDTPDPWLRVQAREMLLRGRTRYNVTVQSEWPGRWYWYSHTWIVGEEHEN